MIEAHLRKVRKRVNLSREEEEAIRGCMSETRDIRADATIIRRGQELNESLMLLSGWLGRARDLADGQRQFSAVHVPGDFADLHGFTLKQLDHNLVSMSPVRLAVFPHDRLRKLFERFPHLARIYWFMTNVDGAIQREWTVSLGRRSSLSRMAHLFSELLVRLDIVGHADRNSYDFPLTQQELGECLGLTAVHVNRTLQELRRRKLIDLENRRATILDLEGLHSVGEFDPFYLYLEHRDR